MYSRDLNPFEFICSVGAHILWILKSDKIRFKSNNASQSRVVFSGGYKGRLFSCLAGYNAQRFQ